MTAQREKADPTDNQTNSSAGQAAIERQANKRLLHLTGLARAGLHAWCEPGCHDPKTNHALMA